MTNVISPFLLNKTRPRDEFSSRQNEYFDLLERVTEQIYNRTGGSFDAIAADSFNPVYGINTSQDDKFLAVSATFETVKFNPVSASSNYTAGDFDFVNATSGVTIDMPLYPCDLSSVIVRNGDGTNVVIDGNGRNINGETSVTIQAEADSFHLYYLRQDDEWVIS